MQYCSNIFQQYCDPTTPDPSLNQSRLAMDALVLTLSMTNVNRSGAWKNLNMGEFQNARRSEDQLTTYYRVVKHKTAHLGPSTLCVNQ